MKFKLRDQLTVEDLGGEFLVCDADQAIVHRVTATNAPWLADLMSGDTIEVDEPVVQGLVDAGLLETVADETSTTSRRRVLAIATAATATVGLTSLVLPSAAAAASAPPVTTTPPVTTEPRPNVPELFVGQGSDGGNPNNRVIINFQQGDTEIDFSYSITGPITTSPLNGSGTGTVVRSVAGWTVGETITIVVTGTNPVLAPITRTLVF